VSEISQLRVEDVVQLEGFWCVRFAPEAGSLKNSNSERAVPLHPSLISQGFLEFVKQVGSGPLYFDTKPDRFGSRGGRATKVLSSWVRSLGLTDPRLSPSHSWRHRLRTLGRRHGLATDILDAITGHQRKTVADSYGEFPMRALYRELEKIPEI
jgi:integrase